MLNFFSSIEHLQTGALAAVKWLRSYTRAHKMISAVVLIATLGGGYYAYGIFTAPSTAPKYLTAIVGTGTIVATLTESGQVSATTNVEVLSKASGEVLSVRVLPGTQVSAGTSIATVDPTTAEKSVRDAQANLESAQIALAKLVQSADAVSLTNAQNAVASGNADLARAHTSAYNDVSSAFVNLPSAITGLDSVLHGYTVPGRTSQPNEYAYSDIIQSYDPSVTSYQIAAESGYLAAKTSYDTALATFKATARDATDTEIEKVLEQTNKAASDISDALKTAGNFLNFVNTTLTTRALSTPSTLAGSISSITGYTSTVNSNFATLSTDINSIASTERSVAYNQASLTKLQTGADPLDVKSSQLAVTRAENSLADANQTLADTVVRAPFDGLVAKVSIQRYQNVGSGTAVATMVSSHQSAVISLNEVDAAKLSVGQKATLTFDALPGVTIAGTVASVDALGTVSQGVVTYGATITFDTSNTEVKSGMSVNASVVTGTKSDVLVVPSSAIKTSGGQSYVQIFNPALPSTGGAPLSTTQTPESVPVVTGLASNTETEIVSGLTAGQQVVVRTVSSTATTNTTSSGATRGLGGGGIRLQ